jgi:hypothetical protein
MSLHYGLRAAAGKYLGLDAEGPLSSPDGVRYRADADRDGALSLSCPLQASDVALLLDLDGFEIIPLG